MNSKKIILLTFVILLCVLLPLIIVFLPQPLAGKIFSILFIMLYSILSISMVYNLIFKPVLNKLISIPMLYVLIYIGVIVYKFKLYYLITNAFSIGEPWILTSEDVFGIFDFISPWLPLGIVVTIIPLIIYILFFYRRLTNSQGPIKNMDSYVLSEGKLIGITNTKVRINKNPVYKLKVALKDQFGQDLVIEKETVVTYILLSQLVINQSYSIYINKKNNKDFFINTANGLI